MPRPGNVFSKLLIAASFWAAGMSVRAQDPVANFSANNTSGCGPLRVDFTDRSTGAPDSWSWDFGNGQLSTKQNPTNIIYAQPGTYTVRLVVKNASGIDDEVKTDYITVFAAPSVSFTANLTTACVPAAVQFTDRSTSPPGSTITSWQWNFGDGGTSTQQNPTHTYTNTGFYSVTLQITNSNGCKKTATIGRYIRIVGGVNVDFAFLQPPTCQPPFLINFRDQSAGPGTLSYSWNFGNGSTSTIQNPSTTYNAPGTYSVKLTVNSDLGCSGTTTKDVVVAGKTTDFIAPANICVGQTVNFQNNSVPAPVSSSWSFSDGTISSQINPVKTFLSGGTYQVKLINNYGNCRDSITKDVTVITSPTIDFSSNDTISCDAPFAVQFTDNSPVASTWFWDFGDGITSTEQNPNHTYNNPGFYDVSLTITLAGGCSNVITKSQYIKIKPIVASISNAPAGGCAPFTFKPIPSIQSIDSVVSYSWDLGEPGAIYNTQFPTHTYNSTGHYAISLTVTTQSGCVKTITLPRGVTVGTKPTADFSFTPNNTCASTPIQFTDNSTTTPGADVTWNWDFGDGGTSTDRNPSYIFHGTGAIDVKLTVSNNGCEDVVTKTITVLPPVAKFGYTVNCSNHVAVAFIDSSLTDIAYGPITYQWDFGDGTISSSQAPSHSYSSLGTYNVVLTVTNGPCSYSTSKSLVLTNEPADFTVSKSPVCKNETFTLNAVTSNPANVKNYTWVIGGTTLTSTTPGIDHRIDSLGSYDVTLTVEDINGCTSSKTIANYITVNGPIAKFSSGPGNCINKQVNFIDSTVTNGVAITEWTWDFGDGTQQTFTSPPFSHAYSQTGSYSVSLTVKNSANCTDKFSIGNAVLITSPIAGFRADTLYCPSAPLQFVDTSTGLKLTYNWDFGDGGTSTLQNPTHSYAANNSYTIKLVVTDTVGCRDSATKASYVNIRPPTAAFDIVDTSGICLPLLTSFTFKGTDYASFNWDFGDGTSTTAQSPSHFYNDYGIFTPTLVLTGPGGCVDSAQATVSLYNPRASTQIVADPTKACNSLTVNFDVTAPPGFKYEFDFGDGSSDSTGQANLTHFYPSPGNFSPALTIIDEFGCQSTIGSGPIHVYGAIPLFGKDKKEFCDTGLVRFKNFTLSNDPVTSTIWNFGDGGSSTDLQPTHFFGSPGTYIVGLTVTTENQCTSSYADTIRVYRTPVVSITGRDTICINSSETFSGVLAVPDSITQWQWTFGNGATSQQQNPSVTYSSAGDFNIQLIAANKLGCSDSASHAINVVPLPTATPVTNPIIIISGGSAQINMTYTGPIVNYSWLPAQNLDCTDCPQPVANPPRTTDYAVQVRDRFGCKNSSNVTVKVVCGAQNFFIPNTFSPNGDGVNDIFYLRGSGLFRINSLMIFNRWGEVVFEKKNLSINDPLGGWDGTYRGKKAKPDVYIYQVEIVCGNGETIKYAGNVALIQ
jgi:gliding motility-associated-like protein